jgi:hypothetical protein
MNRFRSWSPDHGFNIDPAVWAGDGPAQRSGRKFRAAIIAKVHKIKRQQWRVFYAERATS